MRHLDTVLDKYFKIYCHETHKKWPELVPYIENWLNSTIHQSSGYAPIELLTGYTKPVLFRIILKKEADQIPKEEALADILIKA
jgi:hypothetical protein